MHTRQNARGSAVDMGGAPQSQGCSQISVSRPYSRGGERLTLGSSLPLVHDSSTCANQIFSIRCPSAKKQGKHNHRSPTKWSKKLHGQSWKGFCEGTTRGWQGSQYNRQRMSQNHLNANLACLLAPERFHVGKTCFSNLVTCLASQSDPCSRAL